MTPSGEAWTASLVVRLPSDRLADWLERSLRPEASREVPRTRAEVHRAGPGSVEVAIDARDVGALRAAMNTYLGWIELSLATVRAAHAPPAADAPGP